MTGCFPCKYYAKHAQLIKSCYPTKDGEKGPRSSELSYLTFYASSRPVKLTKVGSFLQRKVMRDITKGRKHNNEVSLEIVKELIQSCHHDLNLFSKYVVRILNMMLDTRDISLLDKACGTFFVFCSYHDGSTLGVDSDFTADFESLLRKFANFSTYNHTDERTTLEMRYIGHRALQAQVTSTSMHASDYKVQFEIILPAIFETLITSERMTEDVYRNETAIDIRQSMLNSNEKLEQSLIDTMAVQSANILFSKSNGVGVRVALSLLLQFLDKRQQWWPPGKVVSIVNVVRDSLQAQYRYLLVSEILQQMGISEAKNDGSYATERHASLVSILNGILNVPRTPLVGISVLEVLNALFSLLIKTLPPTTPSSSTKEGTTMTTTIAITGTDTTCEQTIHEGIVHSIGGLASQIYYQNQMNDMTGYLVAKLRPSTTLDQVEGMPIERYRNVTLKCLEQIVSSLDKFADPERSSIEQQGDQIGAYVAPASWTPAIALLTDKKACTRFQFARTLVHYLDITAPSKESNSIPFPKHLLKQHADILFANTLHHAMIEWVQRPDLNADDVQSIYALLCSMTRRFTVDATVKAVPLVFKLQDLVKSGSVRGAPRQRAVAAATVRWIHMIGEYYAVPRLTEYAEKLEKDRRENGDWTSIEFTDALVSELNVDLEDDHGQPVRDYIDRSLLVEALSEDAKLRDKDDTHGLDLEKKLYVEWGSEAFRSFEQTAKVHAWTEGDHKPKLVKPLNLTEEPERRERRESIKVEMFKEALAGQLQSENNSSNTASNNSLQPTPSGHSNGSLGSRKSSKTLRKDVNKLLQELDLNTSHHSTHSLINPPYK